ncbi:RibD family protein [uncultured Sphingomonas sp.]|uniref:RibD family protein n=1 Tax=uncultured Sphingomonas sp. TaxID=158754 RepID=UPI0025F10D0C|nr:RibD family protein [uncultured Sphingomonas sp.]
MKPHMICHMICSLDGRILQSRWRPDSYKPGDLFEDLHDRLSGDAWIVGRVTGQEFAKGEHYPDSDQVFPREHWFARREADAFGVVLDEQAKIVWGRGDIGGDPIVVVLTRAVSDSHLAGLRSDGVSYIFAGQDRIDLRAVPEILAEELGVKTLLVEGGGTANGEFLRAGLIDEISMAFCPAIDGAAGAPSLFHSGEEDAEASAPLAGLALTHHEVLPGGEVWLRYKVENVGGA